MQMDNEIPEKTKQRTFTFYGFLTLKKLKLLKKLMRTYTTSIFDDNSIRAIFLKGAKFNNMSRNKWKLLFEVNFSKNSTKTIRLFALNFYEVIVDSTFGPRPHQ